MDFARMIRAELAYWRHTRALAFQMFVFFLVGFLVSTSEAIRITGEATSVFKNSPVAILQAGLTGLLFSLFATSLFFGRAAARAFEEGLVDWEFSLPVSPRAFFWGRFAGALLLSLLVVLMLPLGIEAGARMPWVDPDKVGPFRLDAYLELILAFLVPGLLSTGATLFALAFWKRTHRAAIAGGVGMFFLFSLSGIILSNLDMEHLAFWTEPFGISYVGYTARYWTPQELNTRLLPLSASFLLSRVVWDALPLFVLAFLSRRFRMQLPAMRGREMKHALSEVFAPTVSLPILRPLRIATPHLFLAQVRFSLQLLFASWVFRILLAIFLGATLINIVFIFFIGRGPYAQLFVPTTAGILSLMSGNALILAVLLLAVFTGELLQGEREQGLSEWMASTPAHGLAILARTVSVLLALALVLLLFVLVGMALQVILSTPIRWSLYAGWVGFILATPIFPYLALAVFLHTLIPRKFLAHMVFLGLFLLAMFAERFRIEQALFQFGFTPFGPLGDLSDMAGLAPYVPQILVWGILWGLAGGVLIWKAHTLHRTPPLEAWSRRIRSWTAQIRTADRAGMGVLGGAFLLLFALMYRELYVVRPYRNRETRRMEAAAYEKRYKHLQLAPVPQLIHLDARVDLSPQRKGFEAWTHAVYVNRDTLPVESLLVEHLASPPYRVQSLSVSRSFTVVDSGVAPGVELWRLTPPLMPGETLVVEGEVVCTPPLVTEDEPYPCDITPRAGLVDVNPPLDFGYDARKELSARRLRKKYGLSPEPIEIPPDTPRADFLGFPRFTFDLVVSLPRDLPHTVVTGGTQVRTWEEKGRRFVRYRGDRPALWGTGGLVLAVAPYEKREVTLEGLRVELFFDPRHPWNVDTVLQGALASLRYHIRHYGPYPHDVLRIAEFPSIFGDYAQSLASFIPYGESMGFLNRLRPDLVPYPVFVIAHEVGHQWWAHQLIPAIVLGAPFITESFSEYVAIRVMEEGRPPEVRAQFLKHELDRYLRARQGMVREERPVAFSMNPSVYYRKGSVVTYATADLIGHETYAGILRDLLRAFPDPPPHPSVLDYLKVLYARTPDTLIPPIRDWHEEVAIYDLAARQAVRSGDTVRFTLEARKGVVEGDSEREVAFREPVDVGLFAGDSLLEVRRIWIHEGKDTYPLAPVPEEVDRVKLDPYYLRVNRRWKETERDVVASSSR